MKNPRVLKKRAVDLLDHMNPEISSEESVDATGDTTSNVDYNFDMLRQHYAGTDFESEANSLCDVMGSIASKSGDIRSAVPVFIKLRMALKGDDGIISSGFEPFDDFASKVEEMLSMTMGKAEDFADGGPSQIPQMDVLTQDHEELKDLPNVKDAQAKLIELEQYIKGMNLDKRQKWKDYVTEARQLAAVGNADFNATPELDSEDMMYLQESERQKAKRGTPQAILEGLVR